MSYKTYENYKDSGINWIGEIPKDWSISRVKNHFAIRSGDPPVKKESGKYEVIGANGCIGVTDDFNITEKHITIGRVGAAGAINITPKKAFVSDNALILEFNNDFIFNYAFYLFKSLNWDSLINKNAQPLITASQVKNLFIPNIHIEEQSIISKFLDKKTSDIDENIAKNKELISLLEEKKTALINQVVTKGLDPNVPMKDSGIEWIGKIPNDWTIFKLKHLCDTFGRIGFRGYNASDLVSEGEGALTLGGKHIQNNKLDLSDPEYLSWEKYYESPEIMVQLNDLIITQRGTLGKTVFIDKDIGPATINPSMILLKNVSCNPKFLYYFLCSSFTLKNIELLNSQTAVPMISQEQANNFRIIIPNKDEQDKIVKFLDENIRVIEQTISKIQENIDLLEEYKTSLIHHAVTGKIDVRDEI